MTMKMINSSSTAAGHSNCLYSLTVAFSPKDQVIADLTLTT